MNKLPLVLSPINLLLVLGLCYYAWTQKSFLDGAFSKIDLVTDDVVKFRLEIESQAKRFASDVVNQEAGLQKLNQSNREKFEEMEESNRALSIKIEELKQHANQLQSLESRIKMIEMEKDPMVDIELLRARCDELEGAIAALLNNALLN